MKSILGSFRSACRLGGILIAFSLMAAGGASTALAQRNNNGNNNNNGVGVALLQQPVGGVSINADGLLQNAGPDVLGKLSQVRAQALGRAPADLNGKAPLRRISLRRLDAALAAATKTGKPISKEIYLLGGLQQIRYVFAYPEQSDIVLVGPAEGWKIDPRGNIVGKTTGRPVMNLDDLVIALRSAAGPARGEIGCSIDPTDEGRKQLAAYTKTLRVMGDPDAISQNMEKALGLQRVSVMGVPATSHLAAVLVSADYRMKRLAMAFDPAPFKGLPSYMAMLSAGRTGMNNRMQRWWLEPKYDGLLRSADGLAWEFQGPGVKCMTEEDFQAANGQREHTGRASALAQRWADNMTRHYNELAVAEPVFGELRNCMELAVAATLIARENLTQKAHCSLPTLLDSGSLKPVVLPAPTEVDSRVSMLRKGHSWVISASGGVAIHSGDIVAEAKVSPVPGPAREKLAPTAQSGWYSN